MSFFRSSTMGYYNIIIPRENAWNIMNDLADLDSIHFVDHDPELPLINRPFANYIKRIDEVYNKLLAVQNQVRGYKKNITYCRDIPYLVTYFKKLIQDRNKASHTYFEEIEAQVEGKHAMLLEQTQNLENLFEKRNQLIENRAVLYKGQNILGQSFFQPKNYMAQGYVDLTGKGIEEVRGLQMTVKFNQMAGIIDKEDEQRFKRIIFRVTKGNVWLNIEDIDDNLLLANERIVNVENVREILNIYINQQKPVIKCVFLVVYPGGGNQTLIKKKLDRVAETFNASRYSFPENIQEYQSQLQQIEASLNETKNLISLTRNQIDSTVENWVKVQNQCNCSMIEELKLFVVREKYLYTYMNYLKSQGSILSGSIWIPEGTENKVDTMLTQAADPSMPRGQISMAVPEGQKPPPTHFKMNPVIWGFQEIVNTYGVPRYKEINPGLFTIVTFPFLFGVMFADIGHGFCLLLLGIYLLFFNKQIENSKSMFKLMLPVRHMIVLMGVFAFYNGWIYNDFISVSLNMFGSCYKLEDQKWVLKNSECTYPIGMDPVWSVSLNELAFINSYKMKLAVIIGVIHMLFGIVMKGFNSYYFRNWLDLIFEFIPQLIFMICTFGFMDFLVIYKWLHYYPSDQAPSIITLLINMALKPTAPAEPPLWGDGVSEGKISMWMLLTSMICVPIMLLPKPLILIYGSKDSDQKEQSHQPLLEQKSEEFEQELMIQQEQSSIAIQNHEEQQGNASHEHEAGDIFVHQVIESIEFVLGSISNTASYLRLWALSLAHGQLAEVFFDMTLSGAIESGGFSGFIGIMLGFVIFSFATIGVLMLMDVMECFLHALRLHWVEFQNKFYKADGYLFVPFSYKNELTPYAADPE